MNEHEIRLKIHEESDLFSPFDPDQCQLSEEVMAFWEHHFAHKHRRTKEGYSIHIFTDTPVNEENVRQKIRSHFNREKEDADHELLRLTVKAIVLGLIGVAVLALWYFMFRNDDINAEILAIIGTVGVWEATDIFIMERPELIRARYQLGKMINSRIEITQVRHPSGGLSLRE